MVGIDSRPCSISSDTLEMSSCARTRGENNGSSGSGGVTGSEGFGWVDEEASLMRLLSGWATGLGSSLERVWRGGWDWSGSSIGWSRERDYNCGSFPFHCRFPGPFLSKSISSHTATRLSTPPDANHLSLLACPSSLSSSSESEPDASPTGKEVVCAKARMWQVSLWYGKVPNGLNDLVENRRILSNERNTGSLAKGVRRDRTMTFGGQRTFHPNQPRRIPCLSC